jgi:transaldolase
MTRLHELFERQGQSPWIDNLSRGWLTSGHLAELRDAGVRGVTSNPTIFAHSISQGADYDRALNQLLRDHSVEDAYWELVVEDIRGALEVFAPVHSASGGTDGFVSVEVSPSLAHDAEGTYAALSHLHERIAAPNLFVKVPATVEGVEAIRRAVAAGRSINVTLIFSLERYDAVIDAYISGLEELAARRGPEGTLGDVHGVASFFVSRVDTEVDRRLEQMAHDGTLPKGVELGDLVGRAAVAQAKLAYELFRSRFSGPRWEALAARGAVRQRPLWASTSTKNPAYPDLLYVDSLIGPDTVNTMPDATLDAFLDHGTVARTVDQDLDGARAHLARLVEVGVDMADVTRRLEDEGVASFAKSFDELLARMQEKANALGNRA